MSARNPETVALIGESPAFMAMLEHVSRAAPLPKPVLVVGERGTGKELIASRLHYLSERWDRPLVKVNCAALTESLLESELFGHEAGAFTGATKQHIGRFEQADGGTLVLDELGTIPPRMQEKILRVIEYGEFQRVGGTRTLRSDVRIVGATNADLPALAAAGRFRADLMDRLAFDVIHVPPLRRRREDIPKLAYHFAVNVTSELKRELFAGFSAEASEALLSYDWPGNVRELKNAVERSVYRAAQPNEPIVEIIFDPFASPFGPLHASGDGAAAASASFKSSDSSVSSSTDSGTGVSSAGVSNAGGSSAGISSADRDRRRALPLPVADDFRAAVAAFERAQLEHALVQAKYKQTAAAQLLGLTYHQFRGLLKKHGLRAGQ